MLCVFLKKSVWSEGVNFLCFSCSREIFTLFLVTNTSVFQHCSICDLHISLNSSLAVSSIVVKWWYVHAVAWKFWYFHGIVSFPVADWFRHFRLSKMDDKDRQKIMQNLMELVEKTNLGTLIPKLCERGVFTAGMIHKYMVSCLLNMKVGWKVFPPAKLKMKEWRYLSETKNKCTPNLYLQQCIVNFPHYLLQLQYTSASVQQVFEFHPSKSLFFLPKPLAYCSRDFFISMEVLSPEVFLQFGEQEEITRSEIQAVGWMW